MDLALFLEGLHLLRPLWLALVPVVAACWWLGRRRATRAGQAEDGLAPHLRQALTVGALGRRRVYPLDGVALVLLLTVIGAAGPSWSRLPDPFLAQTAPAVVVLKVSPSMEAVDVAPSRLERARQKILDFLALRAGARTALIAYAGTAHRVVPMTEDPAVIKPYLEGLTPDVMPEPGADATAALSLANDVLGSEANAAGIVLVADSLSAVERAALDAASGPALVLLEMLPPTAPGVGGGSVPVVRVTADGADVAALERRLASAYRRAQLENDAQPWDDRGWLLAWPAAVLALLWFRRGWTMRWGLALCVSVFAAGPAPARAADAVGWFLTPDQQGRLAFEQRDFARAAERFVDPGWRAYALYRNGRYEEAARLWSAMDSAEAAVAQGMALIRSRHYRDAVRAFETALARDPEDQAAAHNLAVARRIVDYVESTREQSDTGEESGIGADDVVFDNESRRGVESQRTDQEPAAMLTAEQWMNTVDTRTADFLRQRFAMEAARP